MNKPNKTIHVLGIESSCDDTGVAIVREDGKILSNCVHSQLKRHLDNGGIIPTVAKDYHIQNIDNVAKKAFIESGLESVAKDIDAIAVTTRPGLHFSLQVGFNYAKKLAQKYSKPLIPIHHMQAHSLMPLLQTRSIKFPFLTLLLSGGHCLLAIVNRYNKFDLLGSARDEAPGDLLDKVARRFKLKNLGPPFDSISGGSAIELLAKIDGADKYKYFNSIPMSSVADCDFSFTGYRGSIEKLTPVVDQLWIFGNHHDLIKELGHICASLQRVMLIQIIKKLQRAYFYYRMRWRYDNQDAFRSDNLTKHLGFDLLEIEDDKNTIDVVVSGGVAANSYLIEGIRIGCKECIDSRINVYAPDKNLCSDNGLMIAWNGMLRYIDYLQDNNKFQPNELDNSVITNISDMSLVEVKAQFSLGSDLRKKVKSADFKLPKLKHREFKLINS